MNCSNCSFIEFCKHKDELFDAISYWGKKGFVINVTCPKSIASYVEPVKIADLPKLVATSSEPVIVKDKPISNTIVDYEKRSQMIKDAYKDANAKKITCPSCGEQVFELFKCECGKPICSCCGFPILDSSSGETKMICEDCLKRDFPEPEESEDETIEFSDNDLKFVRDAVKTNQPTL